MSDPLERARDFRERAGSDPDAVVVDELRALLKHPDGDVRAEAVAALSRLTETYPEAGLPTLYRLATLLSESSSPENDEAILLTLAHVAREHPSAVADVSDAVFARLGDGDGPLDAAVTVALVQIADGEPEALAGRVGRLAELFEADDPDVRRHVAFVMNRVADVAPVYEAVDGLRSELETAVYDAECGADGAAAGGRLRLDDPEYVVTLLSALGTAVDDETTWADDVVDVAVELTRADAASVRRNASALVADAALADPRTVGDHGARLADLMDDSDPDVRANAAAATLRVAQTHAPAVYVTSQALIELLDDPHPNARKHACTALGHMEDTLALELLRATAENDPVDAVRESAGWAVERIV